MYFFTLSVFFQGGARASVQNLQRAPPAQNGFQGCISVSHGM
jgi:hypothetical protein